MSRIAGLRLFGLTSALFLFAGLASAQTKVAVINMQRAVLESEEITKASNSMQAKFTPRQQEIEKLQRDLQKMQEVVKKLAEEKGYDVVVDVTNAVYFKPALEITAEALAAYNKAYPAK